MRNDELTGRVCELLLGINTRQDSEIREAVLAYTSGHCACRAVYDGSGAELVGFDLEFPDGTEFLVDRFGPDGKPLFYDRDIEELMDDLLTEAGVLT